MPDKLTEIHGALQRGNGTVTGVIALVLGMLCFLGVLAFHFSPRLTTLELRHSYNVDVLRQVMFVVMVITGGMGLVNILFNRARWLATGAFLLIALTAIWGGRKVPVTDFSDGTPDIDLDGFIPGLIEYWTHLTHQEVPVLWRLHAVHHSTKHMDWMAGSGQHAIETLITRILVRTPNVHHGYHSQDQEALDKNHSPHFTFIDDLFGTAVKSTKLWSERYGVLGEYVANGFWKQVKFPFVWKP